MEFLKDPFDFSFYYFLVEDYFTCVVYYRIIIRVLAKIRVENAEDDEMR